MKIFYSCLYPLLFFITHFLILSTTAQAITGMQELTYCQTSSGEKLKLDFYPSTNTTKRGPRPLVALVHGGGWVGGDKRDSMLTGIASELNARGFNVASMNYRLASQVDLLEMVQDLKCGIRYLKHFARTLNNDTQKFGILGGSAGGHLANWVATDSNLENGGNYSRSYAEQSSDVQALVSWFGPTDLTVDFPGLPTTLKTKLFSTPAPSMETLIWASPAYKVTEYAPPALILHGEEDDVVPVGQSETLFLAYQDAGADAQIITYPNLGHGFTVIDRNLEYTSMQEIILTTSDFFEEILTP